MSSAQDVARRHAIAGYGVVGEAPSPSLQGLVQLAASVCQVPTAVINIIDDRYQHQVAAVGMEPSVCSRQDSMCNRVFAGGRTVVVPDARTDHRFSQNPFVTGEIAKVRFYASSPAASLSAPCAFSTRTPANCPRNSSGRCRCSPRRSSTCWNCAEPNVN